MPTQPIQSPAQLPAPTDMGAVNLAKAIRTVESNGNFNAKGKSGEQGAYQFMPQTWQSWAGQYLGDPNAPLTPENQNKVAYSKIVDLKNQGFTPEQVASIWNSGRPDPTGNVGVNAQGVGFNTPQYVKSVIDKFQQFKQGTQNGPTLPNASQAIGMADQPDQPKSLGGFIGNIFSSGGNLIGGLANTVLHPIQTLQGIGQAISHPSTIIDALKQRYGGLQNIENTLYKDPVGVALDAATLLTGAGGAIGAVGEASDASKLAEAANAAQNIGKVFYDTGEQSGLQRFIQASQEARQPSTLTRIGKGLSQAGEAVNPINIGIKGAGKVLTGAGNLAGDTAGKVINSLIKPLAKDFAYGKDPGGTVAQLGITGNSLDELGTNVSQARKTIGQQITNLYDTASQTGVKMDLSTALKPIDDALLEAQKAPRVNSAVITRLENVKADLMGVPTEGVLPGEIPQATRQLTGISPTDAFQFKKDIGDLTKWTGNASDDKIVNRALQKSYSNISNQLKALDDSGFAPGIRKLNQQYGDLTSAENAIRHRELITSRSNLVGLSQKLTAGGGILGSVLTGNPLGAVAGVGGALAESAASSPAVLTRIAKLLAKMTPAEKASVFARYPNLANITAGAGGLTRLSQIMKNQQ